MYQCALEVALVFVGDIGIHVSVLVVLLGP